MELKLVIKTGRSAAVEFDDGGKYYSAEEYTPTRRRIQGRQKRLLQQHICPSTITEHKITAVYAGKRIWTC